MRIYTMKRDEFQLILLENGKEVGYYTTIEGLLLGVKNRALRTGTKSGKEIAAVCAHTLDRLAIVTAEVRRIAELVQKVQVGGKA